MSRRALFPDAHTDGLGTRVAQSWELSWPLPVPRDRPSCCACGEWMVLKDWRFHTQSAGGSRSPWRCDVRLKCIGCSLVLTFGVPVPQAMHTAQAKGARSGWIGWRDGKRILAEAGYFD